MVLTALPPLARSLCIALIGSAVAAGFAASDTSVRHEDVRVAVGDTSLAATIYHGQGANLASLVIAPGSGALGRTFPVYARLAEALARGGVTVLVYDKRGVGGSGGSYHEVADLGRAADDLAAVFQFLRQRMGADSGRVGVLGISQGGWTAPIVAIRRPTPAFYIGISTPGVSTLDQNLHERTRALTEGGFSPEEVAQITAVRRQLWTYYRTGEARQALVEVWQAARTRPWFARVQWPDTVPSIGALSESQQRSFRGVGFLDPTVALQTLRVPVLLVFGAKDRHIDVDRSLAAHRAAFAASGFSDTSFVVLPGLGHLLQPVTQAEECTTCQHDAGSMPVTAPAADATIINWLRQRYGSPR